MPVRVGLRFELVRWRLNALRDVMNTLPTYVFDVSQRNMLVVADVCIGLVKDLASRTNPEHSGCEPEKRQGDVCLLYPASFA